MKTIQSLLEELKKKKIAYHALLTQKSEQLTKINIAQKTISSEMENLGGRLRLTDELILELEQNCSTVEKQKSETVIIKEN